MAWLRSSAISALSGTPTNQKLRRLALSGGRNHQEMSRAPPVRHAHEPAYVHRLPCPPVIFPPVATAPRSLAEPRPLLDRALSRVQHCFSCSNIMYSIYAISSSTSQLLCYLSTPLTYRLSACTRYLTTTILMANDHRHSLIWPIIQYNPVTPAPRECSKCRLPITRKVTYGDTLNIGRYHYTVC